MAEVTYIDNPPYHVEDVPPIENVTPGFRKVYGRFKGYSHDVVSAENVHLKTISSFNFDYTAQGGFKRRHFEASITSPGSQSNSVTIFIGTAIGTTSGTKSFGSFAIVNYTIVGEV